MNHTEKLFIISAIGLVTWAFVVAEIAIGVMKGLQ